MRVLVYVVCICLVIYVCEVSVMGLSAAMFLASYPLGIFAHGSHARVHYERLHGEAINDETI